MFKTLGFVRKIHSTMVTFFPRGGKANAGIGWQMKAFKNSERIAEDPESFGDMESDFMNIHKSHKQLQIEEMQQKEKIKSYIIKYKYFRDPKQPNLLTFAEKEQIRLLNSRDPEEWTIERLAESFPATPDIIKKVLNAKWKPGSINRIKAHDEVVIRNWEQLNKNNLDFLEKLSSELKEHLKKFTKRTREDLKNISNTAIQEKWPIRTEIAKPNSTEFQKLLMNVDNNSNLEEKQEQTRETNSFKHSEVKEDKLSSSSNTLEDETYLLGKVIDRRGMRLKDLQKIKSDLFEPENKTIPLLKENIVEHDVDASSKFFNDTNLTGFVATNMTSKDFSEDFDSLIQYEFQEITVSPEDQKRYEMDKVKDRVYIPRKLRKKGATYRINDCYYDNDGEFLYRVPGMIK